MSEGKHTLPPGTRRWMEALTWHETLADEEISVLTSAVVREWQTWHADADNQRAFDCVSRLTADGHVAPVRLGATSASDDYDPSIAVAEWRAKRSEGRTQNHLPESLGRWRLLFASIAVAAMASMVAFILWRLPRIGGGGAAWREGAVAYETGVGALKTVHLDDGSNITLSGETKLLVTLTKQIRSVRLTQGEAWFRVAHDPKWPFIVQAGDGDIRAVGTAFLVTRDSDRVVVTVTEGTVTVTARQASLVKGSRGTAIPRAPIRVTRGEEVSYRDNGTVVSTAAADTRAATAWTRGRLVFDNEPLRYVVENVNRYFPRHISVTPSAGQLRFSGVIFGGEIEEWLGGLPRTFPVNVSDHGSRICVRMRVAESDSSCDAAP